MFDAKLLCIAEPAATGLPVQPVRSAGLDALLAGHPHAAFLRAGGFTAAAGELRLLPGGDGVSGAVFGLGERTDPHIFGALPMALPEGDWTLLPGGYDPAAAVLGFCLGAYRFTAFKAARRAPARLVLPPGDHARSLQAAEATYLARDLINIPADRLGPAELADVLVRTGAAFGARTEVVTGDALRRAYPAVAAVAAGSDRPGAVAILRWSGSGAAADAPLVSLCGKGVVFDTGGYDIKPPAGMLRMKKDMGGAACTLGLARMVMAADLPVRLELRLGCVENSVSGHAMRPGDVLDTRRGLTVEIGNTDAEGRLVLCDLLAEASDARPDLLIDCATLTGAARVAVGPDLPALFCNDDAVAAGLAEAGLNCADPVWRLPLWAGYDPWLASPIADLNNIAGKPFAGAIVAALFLQRFVAPGVRWVHLDSYAWNDSTTPGRPEGGEALGMRACFTQILKMFNDRDGI